MIPGLLVDDIRRTLLDALDTLLAPDSDGGLRALLADPERGMFRGPYLDLELPYRRAGDSPENDLLPGFVPNRHQARVFERLSSKDREPASTLLVAPPGSGRTEALLQPLLDHCLRQLGKPGVKALLLYPSTELASEHARRLAARIWADGRLRGRLRAGVYTGSNEERRDMGPEHLISSRDSLRKFRPDILLAHYASVGGLLHRPEDARLWRDTGQESLRYLVVPELHRYSSYAAREVAFLIRRLHARLGVRMGSLCCVASCRPLAGGSEELIEHAERLFGRSFPPDAVVDEVEADPDQLCVQPPDEAPRPPPDARLQRLPGETAGAYLRRLHGYWFGSEEGADDRRALAGKIVRHPFGHLLFRSRRSLGPAPLGEWCAALAAADPDFAALEPERQSAVLLSFCALLGEARVGGEEEGESRPLTVCRLQLWVRELHGLVRTFDEPAQLRWSTPHGRAGLPPAVCSLCGALGWAGLLVDGCLDGRQSEVDRAFAERDRELRLVFAHPDGERLCSACLRLGAADVCECGGRTLAVKVRRLDVDYECPACRGHSCVVSLTVRAARLAALALGRLRGAGVDRDSIAFAEHPQEASQRASFFAAADYRWQLRNAIAMVLREEESEGWSLSELAAHTFAFWKERVPLKTLAACLTPPDMKDLAQYRAMMGTVGRDEGFEELLKMRLGLEVVLELGFGARAEASLEKCRRVTAFPSSEALDVAAAGLTDVLRDEFPSLEQVAMTRVRHFLNGLLTWSRLRGSIASPLLYGYADQRAPEVLRTKQSPLLPFFRGRLPRFLSLRSGDRVFDPLRGARADSWPGDWARRALGVSLDNAQLDRLYASTVEQLIDGELLLPFGSPGARVYAIDPARLEVSTDTVQLVADDGHRVTVARSERETWWGMPSLRFGSSGCYTPVEDPPGRLPAVPSALFPLTVAEHSSLLDGKVRERLEQAFRRRDRGDGVQLLVCRPTSRLALDFSAMSVGLFCGMPQSAPVLADRVAQLGRKSGGALALVFVNDEPAELARWERPEELLRGAFRPRSIELNAPVLLRRQYVAYTFDCWARDDNRAQRTPRNAAQLLTMFRSKSFPQPFLRYLKRDADRLLDAFLELFVDELSAATRAALEELSLPEAIGDILAGALEKAQAIIDGQRRLVNRLAKRTKVAEQRAEEDGSESEDPRGSLTELRDEMRQLRTHAHMLSQRYPWAVLSEAGALPDDEHPETGIALTSMLYGVPRPGKAGDARTVEARQYLFEARAGFRELAPYNTVYAEQRRVYVDQVETGGKRDCRIVPWYFCPACGFAGPVEEGVGASLCPECGCALSHQQRKLVLRLEQVSAHSDFVSNLATDAEEVRHRRSYRLVRLLRPLAAPELQLEAEAGWRVELLPATRLLELNTGFAGARPDKLEVLGAQECGLGFHVCRDCGVVQPPRGVKAVRRHRSWCLLSQKKGKTLTGRMVVDDWAPIYLYRERRCEALRWTLPKEWLERPEALASLHACFAIGLRHAGMEDDVLVHEQGEHLFLVDATPGGSGLFERLLRQRWRLRNLLLFAARVLAGCGCEAGCTRCVFAGWGRDDPAPSLPVARQLVRSMLASWPGAEGELDALLADCDPACHPWIRACAEHALPLPQVGFQLATDSGEVEAALAWPDRRLALLWESAARPVFEQQGWTVLAAEDPVAGALDALRLPT